MKLGIILPILAVMGCNRAIVPDDVTPAPYTVTIVTHTQCQPSIHVVDAGPDTGVATSFSGEILEMMP